MVRVGLPRLLLGLGVGICRHSILRGVLCSRHNSTSSISSQGMPVWGYDNRRRCHCFLISLRDLLHIQYTSLQRITGFLLLPQLQPKVLLRPATRLLRARNRANNLVGQEVWVAVERLVVLLLHLLASLQSINMLHEQVVRSPLRTRRICPLCRMRGG